MKLSKCHFFSKEIQYLGHILSTKGIHPLPLKIQAIEKMHPPTTPKQVCAFLGLVGYCRKLSRIYLAHQTTSKIQMDAKTPGSLHETERFHHTGTNSTLSQPQQEVNSLHRCFR